MAYRNICNHEGMPVKRMSSSSQGIWMNKLVISTLDTGRNIDVGVSNRLATSTGNHSAKESLPPNNKRTNEISVSYSLCIHLYDKLLFALCFHQLSGHPCFYFHPSWGVSNQNWQPEGAPDYGARTSHGCYQGGCKSGMDNIGVDHPWILSNIFPCFSMTVKDSVPILSGRLAVLKKFNPPLSVCLACKERFV